MSFLRRPAWVANLNRSSGFTPREDWTLLHSFNFEDGGADGSTYASAVPNIAASGDYGFVPRIWVDAGGVVGKSVRFARQVEVGGANNSRYRCYLFTNTTYITANNIAVEGRITQSIFIPTNVAYRGMGGADAQVWWFCGIASASRFIVIGFDGDGQTLGIWNLMTSDFTTIPATSSRNIGASASPGWHTLDFRYKCDATAGYGWVKWDNLDPIYFNNANTAFTPTNTYGLSVGSPTNSANDLTYFGALDNLSFWRPAS